MTSVSPTPFPSEPATAVLHDADRKLWLRFEKPRSTLVAYRLEEVVPALRAVENAVASGLCAAGFVAYEASPAFDSALQVRPDDGRFPLLWFGLFDAPTEHESLPPAPVSPALPAAWSSAVEAPAYAEALAAVKDAIREGDTYQVNFTYRMAAPCPDDPWAAFLQLADSQRSLYTAWLDTGDWVLCSASPELFLRCSGSIVESRPMKGTAKRGPDSESDLQLRAELLASEKERAEHLMIVDMVRNDLGRISAPGSVEVEGLLTAERYPTVWQLTSIVRGSTEASLSELFAALFPPASITGAPKASTMQLIAALENTPRRVYTGTLGFVLPGGRAQFNVAIRTLLCDRRLQRAEYGVGGGIVWDSNTADERRECELKARILTRRFPEFDLLETLLWTPGSGFALLHRHLRRLARSAEYFGFACDASGLLRSLHTLADTLPPCPHRIRLLLSRAGNVHTAATAITPAASTGFSDPVLDCEPVDPGDAFLRHKTTHRSVYEQALARHPQARDVLLRNVRGEITESTIANLVYRLEGTLWTPPVACGLLPGTYREWLVETDRVRERPLHVDELDRVSVFYLANSVRGLHRVAPMTEPEVDRKMNDRKME